MRNKRSPQPAPADLHPDNPHRGRYDLAQLARGLPALAAFIRVAPHGGQTIDFTDPAAVRTLNRALLKQYYGIDGWDLPADRLCPSVPGRADYLHQVAGLRRQPPGTPLRLLDVGTGASGIYALIAARAFGWTVVASDIDTTSLANVAAILAANPGLERQIELRRQPDPAAILDGILHPGEPFDLTVCNPPFHASPAAAASGSARKWKGLGRPPAPGRSPPALNFGGGGAELWCPGGEVAFIGRLIRESACRPTQVRWYTTLVSKADSLPRLTAQLRAVQVRTQRIFEMRHGQKRSRVLAWSFTDSAAA